jgi:integrase
MLAVLPPKIAVIVAMAAFTGLRRGELRDAGLGTGTMHQVCTENGISRTVRDVKWYVSDCKNWRKRVRVERTHDRANLPRAGFEDREDHRTPCASANAAVPVNTTYLIQSNPGLRVKRWSHERHAGILAG